MKRSKNEIGRMAYPVDNSYSFQINGNDCGFLAGKADQEPKRVKIISQPFLMQKQFMGSDELIEFVIVECDGVNHIILNNFMDSFDPCDYDGSRVCYNDEECY